MNSKIENLQSEFHECLLSKTDYAIKHCDYSQSIKDQMEIQINIKDKNADRCENLKFMHSDHSFYRAAQRGISAKKISAALEFGENIFKQGLIFYILGEKNIPDNLTKEKKSLKNIVVVVSGDSNKVITCYRSNNPFKHIKTKSKRISIKYQAAA